MQIDRRIFMIAGPNGAGKTTLAFSLIPDLLKIYEFINADEIARGLAPMQPESVSLAASKLMIKRLRELLAANKSIAFETTASGTNYLKHLQEAQRRQYQFNLLFLWISSEDLAVQRVQQRIAQGGHSVPEETIRRRYHLGLKNVCKYYLPIADSALIVDNSVAGTKRIIAEKKNNQVKILSPEIWNTIEEFLNV